MTNPAIYSHDPDGREVVGVRLSNHSERAWLYRRDYEAIVAEYGGGRWFANSNGTGRSYVRLKDPALRNNRTVARLVLGNPIRSAISYRDGDRLNLRSSNLEVELGAGGCPKKRRRVTTKAASAHLPNQASL